MLDIAKLSQEDKRQLYAQLSYELGERGGADLPTQALEFWDSLQDAIGLTGRSRQSPQGFVKTNGKKALIEAAETSWAYMQEGCNRGLPKSGRLRLMTVILGCLVAHLKANNIPVTAGVMCKSLGILPDAVDRRFPGYHAAKLIDRIALRPG